MKSCNFLGARVLFWLVAHNRKHLGYFIDSWNPTQVVAFLIPVCRLFMTPALYYTSIVTQLLMTSSVCFQDRYSALFETVKTMVTEREPLQSSNYVPSWWLVLHALLRFLPHCTSLKMKKSYYLKWLFIMFGPNPNRSCHIQSQRIKDAVEHRKWGKRNGNCSRGQARENKRKWGFWSRS